MTIPGDGDCDSPVGKEVAQEEQVKNAYDSALHNVQENAQQLIAREGKEKRRCLRQFVPISRSGYG